MKISKLLFFVVMTIFLMGEYYMLEAATKPGEEFFDDEDAVMINLYGNEEERQNREGDTSLQKSNDEGQSPGTGKNASQPEVIEEEGMSDPEDSDEPPSRSEIRAEIEKGRDGSREFAHSGVTTEEEKEEERDNDDLESQSVSSREPEERESDSTSQVVHTQNSSQALLAPLLKKLIVDEKQLNGKEAKKLASVTKLDLSPYSSITDTQLENVLKSCPKLEMIILQGCSGLTQEALTHIARYCLNIQNINFSHALYNIDFGSVETFITTTSKTLKYLNMRNFADESLFTADQVRTLLSLNTGLKLEINEKRSCYGFLHTCLIV